MTAVRHRIEFHRNGNRYDVVEPDCEPGPFDTLVGSVGKCRHTPGRWHAWLNAYAAVARGLDPRERILNPGKPWPRTRDEAVDLLYEALGR